MTADLFPERPAARAPWMVTLADLALLLVGFLMLMQALDREDPARVAAAIRQGFGGSAAMPVAAAAVDGFAPGSATMAGKTATLTTFAIDAARDPRVLVTITGQAGADVRDVDAATGSAAILAGDRARAVVAALVAAGVPARQLTLATRTGPRAAIATAAFAGEPKELP